MKRLVVCCDGTWNKPDNETITNIEKLARTVQSDAASTGGVQQLVYYVSGVGAGSYLADRVLGGAFGFGLFGNVVACYRFLAQNYEEGDEIFIFGFSRGAYTARSVAGMVARVGLLTKQSLVEERLPAAVALYQRKDPSEGAFGASVEEFKHDHCHPAPIDFLGVFDTVGALGVPGFMRFTPRFHDIELGSEVRRARHALAIDETRLKFAPTLWESPQGRPGAPTEDDRVKQVWFEGAHSDVGGGYHSTGLSDTALLWMAREAHEAGLVFDVPLLAHYADSGSDPIRHDPLTWLFRLTNLLLVLKARLGLGRSPAFVGGLRRLTSERALSVRVASSAVNHFQAGGYEPANLAALAEATSGFAGIVERVVALPEEGLDLSDLGTPPVLPAADAGPGWHGDPMNATQTAWHDGYERVRALALAAGEDGMGVRVPATPAWTARDLLSHMIGLGHDVLAGDEPDDHNEEWTRAQVEARRDRSVADLLAEWAADHDGIVAYLADEPRPLGDLVIHEQDLRGALGAPGARDSDGVAAIRESMAGRLAENVSDSRPLRLESDSWVWQSHEGETGAVLRASGFDVFRALTSRRTAGELRSWVVDGDVEPYLDAFAVLGPLPEESLGE